MDARDFIVVEQTPVVKVQSRRDDGKMIAKSTLRLRSVGGMYADEFVCTLLDEMAGFEFSAGQLVKAALRFSTHKATNGVYYQDIIVNGIIMY